MHNLLLSSNLLFLLIINQIVRAKGKPKAMSRASPEGEDRGYEQIKSQGRSPRPQAQQVPRAKPKATSAVSPKGEAQGHKCSES